MKGREVEEKYLGHLVYLERNQGRMKYRTLRRKGLPVGSGLTEGACKSVIGQRTCGSGQRWRPEGIGAVLTLRAIHRSDRLPRFWRQLSKNYTAKISTDTAAMGAAIAAGYSHTVALRNDGTVVAWGDSGSGQPSVPVGLSGVTAIAASYSHTVALVGTGALTLTITTISGANNVNLSWPDTATGFRVESAVSLTPQLTWNNVTATFQTNGGSISIVLPITGTQKFYRLTRP